VNCERVAPLLPGLAGGELEESARSWVEAHLASCRSCRAEASRYERLAAGLAALRSRPVEPPAHLPTAIAGRVHAEARRRLLPLPPVVAPDILRVLQEHREALASAGAALLVAAGAALVVWRALRGAPRVRPA
jgi:anti-sigma factor RsiW